MQALRGAVVLGMLMAVALVGAPAASAAIEAGDECVANEGEGAYTIVPFKRASASALPLFAPVDGVVTRWKVNSNVEYSVVERLRVLRPTGNPNELQTIGESAEETVNKGSNAFATRIPIRAGDRFGVFGTLVDIVFCSATGNPGDEVGYFVGDGDVGTVAPYSTTTSVRIPMIAVIEPDRDGDGYGDETQDKCPQSAATHEGCPTISLEAFPIALKRSVLVLVSASETSSVQVFGQVGWKPRHRGGALASKTRKPGDHKSTGVIAGLSGGTQTVSPGQVARFNVKLPNSVKRQLGQIPPSKSLKGTITARTVDLAGRVTDRVINIHLKGQEAAGR
jgi:hypothetical protein